MKRQLVRLNVIATVLGLLMGYAACRWLRPYRAQPRPWSMSGEWITTPNSTGAVGYYRTQLDLPGNISNAWIAVAAADNCELIVNGTVLSFQSPWRPNRSFQSTVSERGQRLNSVATLPGLSYPRDYQWSGYANYRLPIFFDLGRSLHPGRNVICVRVDSRTVETRLCVSGEVLLQSGRKIPLSSGRGWKASNLPALNAGRSWIQVDYNDQEWANAAPVAAPGITYRTFDPEVFAQPFGGHWLRAVVDSRHRPIWFETTWHLDGAPDEAWMRIMTNRAYDLYINGLKADPPSLGGSELGASDWIVKTKGGKGGGVRAGSLDPDDADSLYMDNDGEKDAISKTVMTPVLSRDQQMGTCDAYSIGAMLRRGENTISVRLVSHDASRKWSPQIALDARASGKAGVWALASTGDAWHGRIQDSAGGAEIVRVIEAGRPDAAGASAPKKCYLGNCYPVGEKFRAWFCIFGLSVLLSLGLASVLLWSNFTTSESDRSLGDWNRRVYVGMVIAGSVMACAIVLDCCFAVRDEGVWMLRGATWRAILLLSGCAGFLTTWLLGVSWGRPFGISEVFAKNGFKAATFAVLLLCGITRAYRLDYQPTDADEWASLQTILAIVDTGTPKLVDDAFYTRSPLYHYGVAASVAVFGKNVWALRLPSVLFAVATCLLIVRCGKRLLQSRGIGLSAAALFAIHPLAIDMGHQVRFYQQQQFLALLAVYCFCRGFVSEQQMKFRYLALAAFFAAVFSQEISVIIGLSLIPSYLLFARGKDWRTESKWIIVAGCGLVFVILDFVIFQTVCLTKVEGVSPRMEPALGLNLMFPSSLYWIFSLYSRLHFGLSAVFLVSLPLGLRHCRPNVLSLYLTFLGGLVFSTILITGSGVRFQYWLFPIFLLLAVHGARELSRFVFAAPEFGESGRGWPAVMAAMLVTMIGLSWSPWKIPGSYATKILPDVDGALAYVRQNIGRDDALAITAPHTAAALMEVGRVDYDIEIPLLNDFVYRKNGRLIDRNAGAEVMSKLDDLQDACTRHERIWVVLNRDIRFRSPGENIVWQDPGGRFDLFVRTNLELRHQTFLTDVFLWDGSKGRLRGFRHNL